MARPELGIKRVCPETGKKFYDLGKEPIVSPYTGTEYPLSFFEVATAVKAPKPKEETKEDEAQTDASEEVVEKEATDGAEIVSLEDVVEDDDDDVDGDDDDDAELVVDVDIPDLEDDDDASDDDVFLEDDDEDDDVSDIIVGDVDEKDES